MLILTADHGPAVSGAHNTIVTARAGKDLISSLCSGLLTIGPRFGGAIDGAAAMFSAAVDEGLTPQEFIDKMRDEKRLVSRAWSGPVAKCMVPIISISTPRLWASATVSNL